MGAVMRDGPRAGLVVLSGAASLLARFIQHHARLDDGPGLALQVGSLLALAVAFGVAMPLARGRGSSRPTLSPLRASMRRATALVVLLGLIILGGAIAASSYVDMSVELQALLHPSEQEGPGAVIAIGPEGHDVRLSGELKEGTAKRLAALLDANPGIARIHLTSEGGLADEGQLLGDVIAAHRLDTYVPDYCVSACTLAFVRGRERLMLEDARLGFHAPYEEGLFGVTYQDDSAEQRAAYIAAGVAPAFVDEALHVPAVDLWIPKPARLIAAHVATGTVDRYRFPASDLDDDPSLAGARDLVLRTVPLAEVFAAQSPATVEGLAGWTLEAYRTGRSEGDITDSLRARAAEAVARAMARADEATLAALARFLAAAMAAATSPAECLAIGGRADVPRASMVLSRTRPDAGSTAAGLLKAALAANGSDRGPDPGAAPDDANRSAATCAAVRGLYDAVPHHAPGQTAAMMRRVLVAGTRGPPAPSAGIDVAAKR